MTQFSTHESVSLEKTVNLGGKLTETYSEDIENVHEINRCAEWIRSNGFQKVCLQFPDYLLSDSTEVASRLQNILGQTIYVLGDTAYESCCIDYVAASHVNADAIIHFGPTCFSKTSANIPYLNIYEKRPINVEELEKCICDLINKNMTEDIELVLDSEYIHEFDNILLISTKYANLALHKIDEESLDLKNRCVVYVGNNVRKLMNIDLSHHPKSLYYFDPDRKPRDILLFQMDPKVLRRRYFLIEKIKDSRTIGIVIGTLGVKNYLKAIERVKRLVELSGKKYYLISVGKPTVAKLANFAEIDIYVLITCSMNEIYESREFYKPIVTPFDVEMALNSNATDVQFSYDYNRYLEDVENIDTLKMNENETDISLLTGKLRSNTGPQQNLNEPANNENQIARKNEGVVALNTNFGAGFLNQRSWKGLEQNLGQTEVKGAEEGRRGIAQGYDNENI